MCSCCYRVTSRFEASTILSLPVPADQECTSWLTDLYTEFCRTQCVLCDDADAVCCEGECASVQEHWIQKRLVYTPNVLVFRVPRFDGSGARRRFALCLEEELLLPGLDAMELFGAVYFDGDSLSAPGCKYTCSCRGPDDQFWEFNGKDRPGRPVEGISTAKSKSSCLVVYTRRRGGSAFADAGCASSEASKADVPGKGAVLVEAAVREIAAGVVVTKQKAQAAGRWGSSGGQASWDVAAQEWSPVVAAAEWVQCVKCKKIWRKQEEVTEVPTVGSVVVSFTCSACVPMIA